MTKIQSLLAKGDRAAQKDQNLFRQWMAGNITLDNTIQLFKANNRIPKNVDIDPLEFRDWLNSLGYRKVEL